MKSPRSSEEAVSDNPAGAVDALVRAHNWAETPLGSADAWPQALKTAVDIVLHSSFPMIVLWGPELIQIYNDGYADILAERHPAGLGLPTQECWPEVWSFNKPVYDRVFGGETLTFENQLFPITRHGYLEDAYFTLCYSPVHDEMGVVGGVLVTVFETSARIYAEANRDRAESALREKTEKLHTISAQLEEVLEGIGDIFYTLDDDHRLTYMNRKAMEAWGRSAEELIGRHYWTEFPQAVGSDSYNMHLKVMAERQPVYYETVCPILLLWVSVGIYPTELGGISVHFRDISARKKIEQALRESEERNRIALQAAGMASWDWDLVTDQIIWNEQHYILLGMEQDYRKKTPADLLTLLHLDDLSLVSRELERAITKTGTYEAEFRIVRADNHQVRWMSGYGRVVERRNGRSIRMVGVMCDVTDRREAEDALHASEKKLESLNKELAQRIEERTEELADANERLRRDAAVRRSLFHRMATIQEDERRRISRELHDQMGQHLTAFALGLRTLDDTLLPTAAASGASGAIEKAAAARPFLDHLRLLAEGMGRDVHRLAVELRPTALDDLGLMPALRGCLEEWSERNPNILNADMQFIAMDGQESDDNSERLPSVLETVIYRAVQEALTNISRHAETATSVNIVVERLRSDQVQLIVEDDGPGFDTEQAMRSGRLGLAGMRERAEMIGGEMVVESTPEGGTTLFLRLPIETNKADIIKSAFSPVVSARVAAAQADTGEVIKRARQTVEEGRAVVQRVQERLQQSLGNRAGSDPGP